MTDKNLQKIIEGPVYLLEGNDGMVYGNSQHLAKEVKRLRDAVKQITIDAHNAFQEERDLTYEHICEWSNTTLGEPSIADARAGRTNQ